MKRIAIDTNIYSSFKRDHPEVLRILRKAEYIAVNVVVLGELIAGFKCGNRAEKNLEEMEAFLETPRVFVIDADRETSEYYAEVYKTLKRKGKPIPTNDMWVAASAMRHGLALFTLDDHFEDVEGLVLVRTSPEE